MEEIEDSDNPAILEETEVDSLYIRRSKKLFTEASTFSRRDLLLIKDLILKEKSTSVSS